MIWTKDEITSRQNPMVKWASSLSQKKAREEEGAFLAEGEKLLAEALDAALPILAILVRSDRREAIFSLLSRHDGLPLYAKTEVVLLSETAFDKISTENSPQGVICVIKHLDFCKYFDIIYKDGKIQGQGFSDFCAVLGAHPRALALCSLRDPGNLGSVIRSAVAFGVEHLILTADCADLYNPKTVRSAMGSLFRVRVSVFNDAETLVAALMQSGRRVFCAELREGAVPLRAAALTPDDVVMIGNEGHGIPASASGMANGSIYIPISPKTESLNAAVAAALFMWEQSGR